MDRFFKEDCRFLKRGFYKKELETSQNQIEVGHLLKALKLILFSWVSILDLMKLYLNRVLKKKIYRSFNLDQQSLEFNSSKIDRILSKNFEETEGIYGVDKFRSNKGLMDLSLEDLVSLLDLRDVKLFSFLNGVFLSNQSPSKRINLELNGQRFRFKFEISHKNLILMTKSKRKDEYIKLGFKFIKKKMISNYKDRELSVNSHLLPYKEIKASFFKNVLRNKKSLIRIFDKAEPTKKDFKLMNSTHFVKEKIEEMILESLQRDLILEKVVGPSDKMMRDDVSAFEFLKIFFGSQQRKSLSLQDTITCFDFMLVCFKMSD